jgi:signal transduction histidine kinase
VSADVREFFFQNLTITVFAHGVMFFALGFAVWLQRRRATRLTLTSSLIWLAAFAFVESLAVWGYAFVPIQEKAYEHTHPELITALLVLRACVQTIAFLFLLQFGLRLVGLSDLARRISTVLSGAAWAGIVLGMALLARREGWTVKQWEASVAATARYALLLPGAVLSAVGLWRQRGELAAAGMRGIKPYAAAAAGILVVYALFAGVVVDHAPWAPGWVLNHDGWFAATGLPISVVRGLLGLALCIAVVKLLEIFEVEAKQRLEALELARAVAEERSRFGRDLHDGTIQSIYGAGLHLESVAIRCEDAGVRSEVREVVESLNEAIGGIRRYIRALKRPMPTADTIAATLAELTARFGSEMGLRASFRTEGAAACGPLPDEADQHLEQILREALANAARHAGPCSVTVALSFAPDELDLVVADTGVGLAGPPDRVGGQGILNIRERARRLGGRVEVSSPPSGGTRVALAVPLDSDIPAPLAAGELDGLGGVPPRGRRGRTSRAARGREVATLGAGPVASTGAEPLPRPAEPDGSSGGQSARGPG